MKLLFAGKLRRIILRAIPKQDPTGAEAATGETEEKKLNDIFYAQCLSTETTSLREKIVAEYHLYIEQIENIPVCIVVSPRRDDRVCRTTATEIFKSIYFSM